MTFKRYILAIFLIIACTPAHADSVWDWIWSSPHYDPDTKTAWWTAQGVVPVSIRGHQFKLRVVRGGSKYDISGTIRGQRVVAKAVNLDTDNDTVSFTGTIVMKDEKTIELTSSHGDFLGLSVANSSN
jgi:hypothetical protein